MLARLSPIPLHHPFLSTVTCLAASHSIIARSISYTKSKKFALNGTYYDPILRQHELLQEHLSPKFYEGDQVLDPELRQCEDDNKPFLLKGREELLTTYKLRLDKWVEGVVPPRNGMTVAIFLRTLGRGCDAHIHKFPTWDHLFLMKGWDFMLSLGERLLFFFAFSLSSLSITVFTETRELLSQLAVSIILNLRYCLYQVHYQRQIFSYRSLQYQILNFLDYSQTPPNSIYPSQQP